MWYEKYIAIPFVPDTASFESCDCAGLIFLVLNTELKLNILRSENVRCDARRKHELMRQYRPLLEEVSAEEVKPFDIFFQAEGHCWHTGVVVNNDQVIETTLEHGVKLRSIDLVLAQPTKFYRLKNEART